MRVEWTFTSDDVTALLAEIAHINGDAKITDVEFDELADVVVVGLEIDYADTRLIELLPQAIGELQN